MWDSRSMMRRVRDLPEHLNELSSCLRNLSTRVRETVAEAVGTTVGRAVQDGLAWLLDRSKHSDYQASPEDRYRPSREERYVERDDWDRTVDDDGWEVDEPRIPERRPSPSRSAPSMQKTALLALTLKAGGCWLLRRGSWKGAVGLGLLISGLAAIGGPIAAASIGIMEAAADLMALNNIITSGAALSSD